MKHDSTILKNANVLQSVTGKITTTALYSETTKLESCFKDHKNAKLTKRLHACKGYACTYSDEVLSFLILNCNLRILNLLLEKVILMMYSNQSMVQPTIWNIKKSFGKGLDWVIDLAIDPNINISKCNPLAGSSYVKLPKESNHPKKYLINIQNINDNECFKWCLVTYLPPG